ncbi:MAG: type VI secretion system contractile sheath large subunit [Candidatus Eisenbacteria bacterium]|nr:type VI secretion system contractile sheath large subunit [Candidatus Eisenbacteria bacterium]
MSTLPWRILVVTDLGTDSRTPARVTADTLAGWFAGLNASIPLPGGAAHAAGSLDALAPAALKAAGVAEGSLDAALHEPRTQRLEAAWRGLSLLLSHASGPVVIEALSLPRGSLVPRFREAVHGPELVAAEPVSLVVLDYDFTNKAADLAALGELAAMAAELQAPIVANAGAGFFDLRFLVQAGAVKDLAGRLADSAHSGWQAFQKSDEARWLCLTLNRFLLREPWKLGGWSEACTDSNPDSYLWGRGGWLVAAAVARSVAAHGHALDLSGTGGRFDGLATRDFPVNANESKALASEVPFAETQALELTHAAFTTLTGGLDLPSVMMSLVVTAHRFAPGRLTVEGTLAYQLTAARVALACGVAAGAVDGAAGADAIVAGASAALRGQLGGLLGDSAEALTVRVLEAEGGAPRRAQVVVAPMLKLEGKSPKFEVEIALD